MSSSLGSMNPLVTPEWLSFRLRDLNTVILDASLAQPGATLQVDMRASYLEAHIPGAIFFDIEQLSDHATSLPHMLPLADSFARSMAVSGVGSDMNIVVYEQAGVFSAPRARWMLRTFGAERVYVLDGGLRGWIEAEFAVESGEVQRAAATFSAKLNAKAVRNFTDIQQKIAGQGQIVDARSGGRFRGKSPEPRAGIRSGHMPGAINIPYTELTEDRRMRSAEQLRRIFSAKQLDLDDSITTTCGSGITAAVVSLALEIAGARRVDLYDGSWTDYAQHPEAVIQADEVRQQNVYG